MFRKKNIVSLIDSNWNEIERNIHLRVIPNKGEFIWYHDEYYSVLNVVHMINQKNEILLIINKVSGDN